jgi:glycosyltransferase involved in cell wall biosynthesis
MISIVLPVYNEQDNVGLIYQRLTTEMERLGEPYELLFVDDGSSDGSLGVLTDLCQVDPHVRAISLSRNFGHQIAISAGLEHASGQAVIVMDADLQHPPEVVPELIAQWKAGFDVVVTVRAGVEHAGLFKRVSAAAFYNILNRICDIKLTPNTPDFRLMDRRVVDTLLRMPERARFLRGLVNWVGFKQTAVEFVASPRLHGKTKYPLSQMVRFSVDGVTAFSSAPLRLSSYMGLLAALASVPYAIWAVYSRLFTNDAVHGWASVIVAVIFLGGVQLIAIGILGEYLGRIYEEVKGRPLYVAREIYGMSPAAAELTVANLAQDRRDAVAHGALHLPSPSKPHRRPARVLSR